MLYMFMLFFCRPQKATISHCYIKKRCSDVVKFNQIKHQYVLQNKLESSYPTGFSSQVGYTVYPVICEYHRSGVALHVSQTPL